jgi:DNA (cytosine-5)-methyltransferase 1
MSGLTAVSLFAGVGGIDLALERSGIAVKAAVEIDPACRGVIRRHFPQTALFNDVTEVTGDQLRAAGLVPGRGIITAGWPCQGNSVAGRRKGMDDPRSGLWRHVVRILAEARPRWFIGENVPGLLSIHGGRDFGAVLRDLDDLGYGVSWRVLDASGFGVPQRRRRVFIAGCLGDGAAPVEVLLEPEGGDGHPAAGRQAQADIAGTLGSRAGGSRTTDLDGHGVYVTAGTIGGNGPGGGWRVGADEAAAGQLIASTLQGGGRRGHRVDAEGAAGGHLVPMAFNPQTGGSKARLGYGEIPTALQASQVTAVHVAATLSAGTATGEGADASEDGTGRGTPIVAYALTSRNDRNENWVTAPIVPDVAGISENQRGEVLETPYSRQLTTGGGKPGQGYGAVREGTAVRRLTPMECERLQGFPDEWTRWLDDGTEQSDSARYRQAGNAVAVCVAEWIASRVVAVDSARDAGAEEAA